MNDGNVRLEEIYRRLAADDLARSGEKCPSPEELARLLAEKMPGKRRRRILAHVSMCESCAEGVRMLLGAEREIDALLAGIPVRGAKNASFMQRLRTFRFGWPRPIAIGAVFLALIGLALLFVLLSRTPSSVWRGEPAEVELISPVRSAVQSGSLEFRWRAYPGAESYQVQVYDSALSPLWNSGRLTSDRLSAPDDLRSALKSGGSYFWMVSALPADGPVVKSGLAEFTWSR